MNRIRKYSPVLVATVLVFVFALFISQNSFALTITDGVNAARGSQQPTQLFGVDGVITTATNVLLFIVGALSVIMLIIGGLRYVISGGNATAVTAAKNTILYAIVGLVISFLAYAVINFVISTLAPGATSGGTNV